MFKYYRKRVAAQLNLQQVLGRWSSVSRLVTIASHLESSITVTLVTQKVYARLTHDPYESLLRSLASAATELKHALSNVDDDKGMTGQMSKLICSICLEELTVSLSLE